MADEDTVVIIDIHVEDNSSEEITEITNNVVHLHQAVQREEKQEDKWQQSLKKLRGKVLEGVKATAKLSATVLAVASASGPAVAGLLAVAKATATVGKAAAHLTPLVAFAPSLIGALTLVKGTLKLAGPGLARAFEPITRQFVSATGEATKLGRVLQRVVGIDVRPAAARFAKLNMPAIAHNMERIAYQTNLVVAGTLRWANSVKGVAAIKAVADSTGDAFTALVPHILRLVGAFGTLSGAAGGRAITGLGDAIGRLLDKISAWAEQHDIDDINAALKDLSGYGGKLKDTFTVIRDVGRWMGENVGKVKAFSDAVAVGAITIGIATGNLPAIIGGAVAIIVNHWDKIKSLFSGSGGWLKDTLNAWEHDARRVKIAESMMKAWASLKKAFSDAISDIGPRWTQFTDELKIAWDKWAPLIKIWWDTVGKAVFTFVGAALGTFVTNLVTTGAAVAFFVGKLADGFKWMVTKVLDTLGFVINGAAKAFGWIPGLGVQLKTAAAGFNAFRDDVNRALNGIETLKTIRVNASVYVTGGGSAAGGVDQRTGNSRNAGLSGLTSWQRVAEAFAGDRGGSRSGGPTPVTATVNNTVLLDGRPFRMYTDTALLEAERRTEWRSRNGKR